MWGRVRQTGLGLMLATTAVGALVACGNPASDGDSIVRSNSDAVASPLTKAPDGRHLNRGDCLRLGRELRHQLGVPVHAQPRLRPLRFTQCSLRSRRGLVVVYLDSTIPIRGRYLKRIDGDMESGGRADDHLQAIEGVGEGVEGEPGAFWLPSFRSLYAYRRDGWLTLLYSVGDESDAQKRAGATALARIALLLTKEG
jgi:hypothetical protein